MSALGIKKYTQILDRLREPVSMSLRDIKKLWSYLDLDEQVEVTALMRAFNQAFGRERLLARPDFLRSFDQAEDYINFCKARYVASGGEPGPDDLAKCVAEYRSLSVEARQWLTVPKTVTGFLDLPRLVASPDDVYWPNHPDPERLAYIDIFEKKLAALV